jgi:hypothetical protein
MTTSDPCYCGSPDYVPEINVCGDAHTRHCPVHGLDLWYDTCWGCHDGVSCQACRDAATRRAGVAFNWVRRTLRIVGVRFDCVDPTGKKFKLAAWATTLPKALRRFAAYHPPITGVDGGDT